MEYIPGTTIEKPEVQLVGEDGNAFLIIGRCMKALRRVGAPVEVRNAFQAEATSGDYDHLLSTLAEHCQPPNEEDEPVDTIYERAALAIQAAERALATVRSLLADAAVNDWTEDERISIHAGLTGLAEDAEELAGDVPAPIEDDPEAGGK